MLLFTVTRGSEFIHHGYLRPIYVLFSFRTWRLLMWKATVVQHPVVYSTVLA